MKLHAYIEILQQWISLNFKYKWLKNKHKNNKKQQFEALCLSGNNTLGNFNDAFNQLFSKNSFDNHCDFCFKKKKDFMLSLSHVFHPTAAEKGVYSALSFWNHKVIKALKESGSN